MADPVTINLRHVARGLDLTLKQVEAVVELLDEGNTVPFITRYRKDRTGGLDEEQVREIQTRLVKLRLLAERKQTILRSIEAQGKLTEKLSKQIFGASTTKRLEDLYLPFKPKKQTLSTLARSRGLELLANEILTAAVSAENLDARAADFANPDRQVPTAADALLGAGHILAEQFSEMAELRHQLREILQRTGKIVCSQLGGEKAPQEKAEKPQSPQLVQEATELVTGPASTEIAADSSVAISEVAIAADASADEVSVEEASADALRGENAPPVEAIAGRGLPEAEQPAAEAPSNPEMLVVHPASDPLVIDVAPDSVEELIDRSMLAAEGDGLEAVASELVEAPPADSVETAAQSASGVASGSEVVLRPAAPSGATLSKAKQRQAVAAAKREKREQKKKKEEHRKLKAYADYFDYSEEIRKIPPHRILAINRGERAHVLRVKVECDMEAMYKALDEVCVPPEHPHADFLRGCARDALVRLILPSLEREVRRELTDYAELHAVQVFARNLRNLLLQPPVRDRRVLAVDPGFKSGCKLVALDPFGHVLAHDLVYLIGRPERRDEAKQKIAAMVEEHQLSVVAIGNGTACRDTEEFFAEMIANEWKDKGVAYVIVNEAGASVYSTSRLGREEFPNYDATLRGAISIGRRLQDPLSELVKIEPANIGVGLYQHDVKAKHLEQSLDAVVESCVNYVGVDVNTASPALLRYVSGLNQLTARRLFEHRMQHGPFRSREELKQVPGVGEATFVQAAGFLKISGGENPLDATWIHPESYDVASRVLEKLGCTTADLANRETTATMPDRVAKVNAETLAGELQVGTMLLNDIVAQLARPGRDPREDLPQPIFKQGVLKLEDLEPGLELNGRVLNVVDFGAFVDIGLHDTGLVHVSQMAGRFVRDPHEFVAVGDIVRVWVLEVDKQRRRVSLTMIPPGQSRQHGRRPERPEGQPQQRSEGRGRPPRGARPQGAAAASGQMQGQGQGQGHGQGQAQGRRFDSQRRQQGGRPQGPRREGQGGPPPRTTFKPKAPPKPLTPLTDEMKSGKAPLRTFGDLMQFFDMQQGPPRKDEPRKGNQQQPGKGKDKQKQQQAKPPEAKTPEPPVPPATDIQEGQATPGAVEAAAEQPIVASSDIQTPPPVETPPQAESSEPSAPQQSEENHA